MKSNKSTVAPVAPAERIISLDVLRGFAVLGILIMNIQSFSLIGALYTNPTAYGNLTGINKWIWILSHILADQKFMTLFSIMFGAGVALMTGKAEAKGRRSAGLHYRRTFWLLIIGLMHAYLLWHGDVLVTYALCALVVFLFRKMSPKKLLIIGLILISVGSLIYVYLGITLPDWHPQVRQAVMTEWKPGEIEVNEEIAAYRGTWSEQMTRRPRSAFFIETFMFLLFLGWRAGGLMLIGMALYKWGILTAQRSKQFYRKMMGIGFGVGLLIVIYGVVSNFANNWSFDYSMFLGWQFNYWGSLFIAAGYIGMVMLVCQAKSLQKSIRPLAAVGQMALTNYLLQTVICTLIFYGHGLGLFQKVERPGQILILLGIWVFQLVISPIWLRYFRFGPAEWLWRSLTYLKFQPLR